MGGLEEPGQVDDGIRAPEVAFQVSLRVADVHTRPFGLGDRQVARPPGETEDGADRGLLTQCPHDTGADVARGPK